MRRSLLGALFVFALTGAHTAQADTLQGAAATTFALSTPVSNLNQPTSFAFLPDGRMVITQKTGEVVLSNLQGTERTIGTFPVNTISEQGLLNVLLHPQFATNKTLIFYYSRSDAAGGTTLNRHRVVTVQMTATDDLDMTTETVLVQGLRGPMNHDGGALALGPDGFLYIGVGDTGCNSNKAPVPTYNPTNYFATCLTNGNGKLLRVDLTGAIPPSNPLVGNAAVTTCGANCGDDALSLAPSAAREDIWAWGFRNPWRIWFDPVTGNLWVGDVGEVTYEEIDVIPPSGGGKHYGWPWREGGQGWPVAQCQNIAPNKGDCVDPQYYCQHGTSSTPGIEGNCESITGGLIVDSCAFPAAYRGKYYFADNANGWLATLDVAPGRGGVTGTRTPMITGIGTPVNLGVGPDGALYYAANTDGNIQRMAPIAPATCSDAGSGNGGAAATGGAGGAQGGSTAKGGTAGSAGGDTCCAGASGAGRGGSGAAGPVGAARSGDSGGCGCTLGKRSPSPLVLTALAGLVALGLTYRKRRSG